MKILMKNLHGKGRKANGIEVSSLQFLWRTIAPSLACEAAHVSWRCAVYLSWKCRFYPDSKCFAQSVKFHYAECRSYRRHAMPFWGVTFTLKQLKAFKSFPSHYQTTDSAKSFFFCALETSFSAGTQKPPPTVSTNGLAVQHSRFLCAISADMVISSRTNCQLLFLASSFRDL